jgi:hypothetical protein
MKKKHMSREELDSIANAKFPTEDEDARKHGMGWCEWSDQVRIDCSVLGAEWDDEFLSNAHTAGMSPWDAAMSLSNLQDAAAEDD